MKKKLNTSEIMVGMGATICYYSDREPATLIQILHNGRRIVLRTDKSIRTDNNGMSEIQKYNYEPDPNGAIHIATLRKDGSYRLIGEKTLVDIGSRCKYYDYSF